MKKAILSKFGILMLLCGVTAAASLAWAAETRVVASLDRTQVVSGKEAFLTIRILDGQGNIQAPEFPPVRDLDIHYAGRASRMTLVNGVSSSSLEFSYVVSPRRAGTYAIPSVNVSVGGRAFATNPLTIEVVAGAGSMAPAPATNNVPASQNVKVSKTQPPAGADNRIFAEAQLSKPVVYQNEQALLNYALYTSFDTRYEGFESEPELSGFWIEEFPLEKDVPREMVSINGRRYIKADIKKVALFPTSPGKYTIQTGKIKTTIKQDQPQGNVFDEFFNDSFFNGGNFFSKRETRILTPRTLEIEVKPLPDAGKPKGFQGDVGRYQMNATLDRAEVQQNEPVKMTLVIEGTGNIDRVNRPTIPDLKGFRTYEADSKSEVSRVGDLISGRKTFEVVFIPKDEGKMFIPPLEFSFFDPVLGQYQTVRTPNYPLTVLKGEDGPAIPDEVLSQTSIKKDVQVEGRDIRFIETRWTEKSYLADFSEKSGIALALLNLLALLWAVFLIYRKSEDSHRAQNRGLYRTKQARQTAAAEMRTLRKLARARDIAAQTEFFEHLEKAMNQYFSDKWNWSAYETTRSGIDRKLHETLGAQHVLFQEVAGVYQLCDEARFARAMMPDSSKELALRVFKDIVNRLEK